MFLIKQLAQKMQAEQTEEEEFMDENDYEPTSSKMTEKRKRGKNDSRSTISQYFKGNPETPCYNF